MKRLHSILLFFFILSFSSNSFSQSRDYPIITQNGKEFYLYEVKRSDGLYKISKTFKVSQEEILKYNPQALSGINKGMKLRIPVLEPTFTAAGPVDQNEFIIHSVKTGETLYSIAKRYSVTANEIWDLNIEARNGIKEGMTLKIPKSEAFVPIPNKQGSTSSSSTRTHTVLPKETLYSLSKQYNTTISELLRLNPELSDGLKIGQEIKIPGKENEPINQTATRVEAPVRTNINTKVPTSLITGDPRHGSIIKVALLMPFMLDSPIKQDATIDKFVEFYEGVLLAIDQLKQDNVSVELITYDIEKTSDKVKLVLQKNYVTLKNVDLIIGPAYSSQVDIVADFAKTNYIPLVVPFSPKIRSVDTNPYLFQNNTPQRKQFVEAAQLFIKNFSNKNIIIVEFNNDTEDNGSEFTRFLKVFLDRDKIPYKEMPFTQENYANIKHTLVENKENIVLFATERPNIIKDLLPKVVALNSKTTPISVFGFSAWDNTLKSYPSTYFYTSFFVDRKSKNNGVYRNKFRQEFGYPSYTTSPRFDLMGYDIAHYFIMSISRYGKSFIATLETLQQTQSHTLQTKFKFEKQKDGGYLNTGLKMVHYTEENDFEAVE